MAELRDYLEQYTLIEKTKISLHKKINSEDIRLIYGDFKRLYIIDKNDCNGQILNYLQLARIPKTIYGDPTLRFYNYYADVLVNPYVGLRTMQQMNDEPIDTIRNNNLLISHRTNLWNAKVWVQLECESSADGNDHEYFMVYYMNKNIIRNVCEGKKEPSGSLLLEMLSKVVKANKMRENNNQLEIIKSDKNVAKPFSFDNFSNDDDNYNLTENYLLYEYQKSDVNWMKYIESNVESGNNEIQFSYSPITHVLDGKLVLFNNILLPRWLIADKVVDCKDSFRYLGGNLISEMGLGKSIVCLSRIFSDLENDPDRAKVNHFVTFKTTCNYCYKRGKNRGKMCENEISDEMDGLYCKTHSNSAFYDKRALEIVNKEAFDIRDFVTPELKFKTNATLVIAPNQLCDQWVNEYLTKFVNDKRVVMIVTSDQYDNIRLMDLLFADVVITSYQFVSNLIVIRENLDVGKLVQSGVDVLNKRERLFLHNFKWKRIILDEVHELSKIVRSKSIIQFVSELQSKFKWNVTGTPFANGLLSFYLLMGLNTTLRGELLHMDERSDYIMQSLPLFRRNSRESIKNEFSGNIIKEHYKFLTFTSAERSIYDGYLLNSKAYNFLIQICCHTELFNETKELIKNCKTFEEIQEVLVDWNKNQLEILNANVCRLERNIEAKVEESNNERDEEVLEEIRAELGTLRKNLTISKKNAENVGRTYNYLKYTLENLKENVEDECCPICLDTIGQDELTITKCGHRFCVNCISKVTNDSYMAKCPQCNQQITQRDVYVLKNAPVTGGGEQHGIETLDGIISRVKSTKVGNIVHFLRNTDPNDKVIVFSQWDEILKKVGQYLTEYKLKHVFCTGSVYQKKAAIKNFVTKKDVNIIMLSSKNAASGINLTAANKIVLIEPVYGTDEYRESIEAQAIGRADRIGQKRPIDVFRFIIKDTVEEEIVSAARERLQ